MILLHRRAIAAALTIAAFASAAAAEDPPVQPKAEAPAETRLPPGSRVRARLRGGRTIDGVLLADGMWERRDARGSWIPAKRGEPGAGVRLWWVHDLDGFLFVTEAQVVEMKDQGVVTREEERESAKRRREASERAAAERARLDETAAKAEAAATQAKALIDEVEKAKQEAAALALVEQQKEDDIAKAKRWAELLARFPPSKWSPETPQEIDRRRTLQHVYPSDDEIEFLKTIDEWKPAFAAWKSAQEKATKGAGGSSSKSGATSATKK